MSATRLFVRVPLLRGCASRPGVILKRLNEVFSRALKRRSCSALLICSQNLRRPRRRRDQLLLELVDLVVRAQPVGRRAEALDALDQHAAVPRCGRRS